MDLMKVFVYVCANVSQSDSRSVCVYMCQSICKRKASSFSWMKTFKNRAIIITTTTTTTKQQQKITKCFNRIKRIAKRGNVLIKLLGQQQSYANTKVRAKSFNLIYVMFSFFWVLLECIKVKYLLFLLLNLLWFLNCELLVVIHETNNNNHNKWSKLQEKKSSRRRNNNNKI